MTKKQRYEAVLSYFRQEMPEADTELEFGSIFQLLVAVVLSAQCTDKRINQVTPELFRQYPDAKAMAKAEVDEVLEYIKSVSYPNAKAEHLVKMARMLVERRRRGACRHEPTAGPARCRSQDGQRHPVGSLWQVDHGCRHPRIPCESSSGVGRCQGRQSFEGRTGAGKKYTRGRYSTGTSLVIAARPLCLYGAPSSLRALWS